jgi:restriction system protein
MLAPDPRFGPIDNMQGPDFEKALVELFERMGYDQVCRIGGFDKGADITFIDEGERVAVQAKRSSSNVGIDAVRQLVDGVRRYECNRGIVVTNAFFTLPAIECAEAWAVELWDRNSLAGFLEGDAPVIDSSVCAKCGAKVSSGVTKWCLDQPWRYGGNVYCPPHQARSKRSRELRALRV